MGLDDHCGSPFWDLNGTWYTDLPDFPECFHQTILVWIPCGFIWLFAPFEIYKIINNKEHNVPWTYVNISKTIINLLLVVLAIINIGQAVYDYEYPTENEESVANVFYVTPAIMAATFVLVLSLTLTGKKRGVRSSGVIFLFWFILAISGAFTFYHRILQVVTRGLNDEEKYPFIWYMIYYPFVLLMVFVNCFSDSEPKNISEGTSKQNNPSPEEGASFPSRMVYQWFDAMAWKGYKRPLEMKDLWDLNNGDKSKTVVPRFDLQWEKSLRKRVKSDATKATFAVTANGEGVDFKAVGERHDKTVISVLPALCRTFGSEFLFGAVLKLFQDLLAFVSPQILKFLISFVKDKTENVWKGYFFAIILTVTALIQTIFLGQYFQRMFVVGMRIRTAMVAAIYRKALRISNSARKESTVGEIVNLMSVDAQRFMDLTTYLNMLWSAPLQIALAIYFLYDILGPSVFAGLGVMILLIPVNGFMANATKKLQVKQMKNKDKRVKMMNEILSGIKVLKLYAWEPSFQANVEAIRDKEIKVLKQAAYLSAGTSFLWTCAPFLVTLMTFAVYVLSDPNQTLDAEKAFVSLTLFNLLRFPMSMFPMLVAAFVQASVSLKRLNKFLNADELDTECVAHDDTSGDPVVVENASFSWAPEDPPVLKNINFAVKPGKLVAVVGQVGAGKSSLISALLGEMNKQTGRVSTVGKIAYVPQQAWIQNCSLRENILFGKNFNESVYHKVVDSCALRPDLNMLPGGDATEIGEKGINLSGGQKQRVSLARAVYCDMDVYFLDDPLSAVDSHVGKHIFDKVIGSQGMLKDKTRILVTHGITYLPQVDQIIILKDGEISESGTYKDLLAQKGAFSEFLLQHLDEGNEEAEDDLVEIKQQLESSMGKEEFQRQISRRRSELSESQSHLSDGETRPIASPERSLSRSSSNASLERSGSQRRRSLKDRERSKSSEAPVIVPARNDKLIEAEKAETGKVKMEVYSHYLRSIGFWMAFWTLLLYVVYQGFSMYSNIWLSEWSGAENSTQPAIRDLYLGVYGALGLGQATSVMVASVMLALCTLKASLVLHSALIRSVLRLPMAFFDTTPAGRFLNRFSKDVDAIDNTLPFILRGWITTLLAVISTIFIIGYTTPIFFAAIFPIGILYYWIQHVYVATSRQLKRMESVTRSPIYSHFGETLTGASVIRAYGQQQRFIDESENRVDTNQISYYPSIIANRWLSIRLETIGNLIVLFAALFAVIWRDTLDPGLVGLSISYALNVTQTLNWFMRMTSEVETNIVAVERIKEYCESVQEASWENGRRSVAKDWPDQGKIHFENYQVRYREGLDLVLKGISCQIEGGEKVGIVGRTGAGKSSLTLGLFRIIEAAGGAILIDGVNIADLGLHALRSRLTIIPQDPVLFSGTLRMNLDPFNKYSDEEVWRALEHAHLKTFVSSLAAGLQHEVSEGGENLSVGQRQLICLARALLRKTKVLVLDEATAAVDLETDDLIQATIRKEFKECTVVTIAHRLNTILDSNRVMVLDKGEIREFASPTDLLANKQSIFYGMAKDAGLV
nr:ABCC1-2 protein [Diaphanosoma celebensis]